MERSKSTPVRRRTKLVASNDKKIADDEFMAAAIGDMEWLKQSLRNKGTEPNYDQNGLAPIHLAAIHGRLECLKLLIEKLKLDVNMGSTTGWRPVHLVISNQTGKRSFQCLLYLLDKGADPSVVNDDGITPMHQAASEGHVPCLKALIETGAVIDGEDRRGHKPIDLAKLWGHRKCARILAAEMWHREKDFLSRELFQLQKVQMQQVLRDMEDEQVHKFDQQFYGELAYRNWLEQKQREKDRKSPKPQQNQKGKISEKSSTVKLEQPAPVDVLQKPNSLRPLVAKNKGNSPDTKTSKQSSGTYSGSKKDAIYTPSGGETGSGSARTSAPSENATGATNDKKDEQGQGEGQGQSEGQASQALHEKPWDVSTHLPPYEHLPKLPDYYPRDEYTMQPKYPLIKGGVSGPHSNKIPIRHEGIDPKAKLRKPKLPPEVLERLLMNDGDVTTGAKGKKPVVYKCKNILDVQTRKHYDAESLPKPEAAIHMCDDVTSALFQSALQRPLSYHSASNSSLRSNESSASSSHVSAGNLSRLSGVHSVKSLVQI